MLNRSPRPAMFGDVYAITFGIADPAFRDRAERVRLGRGLGRVRDRRNALDFEAEVVDAVRLIRPRDQRDADEAVRKIDGAVRPAVLLLEAEDLLVVVGELVAVLHVDGDVPDPRLLHGYLDASR